MKEKVASQKKTSIIFIVVLTVMLLIVTAATTLYFISENRSQSYGASLEDIYQRSFYELVDNVNNIETKLSKLLASSSPSYQEKLLSEISDNAISAESNVSVLPLSISGISDSVEFINKLSGYVSSLELKISSGGNITSQEIATLEQMYSSVKDLKVNLNEMSNKFSQGYSILRASQKENGDFNSFTVDMQGIKSGSVDYPAMIYDGPFSDSTVNSPVLGLNDSEISADEASSVLAKLFTSKSVSEVKQTGETNGRFATYNFELKLNGCDLYLQLTKKGGKLLTLSGCNMSNSKNLSISDAENIAVKFALLCGIENATCVWSDIISSDAYINIAPMQNGVILYPDLVKIKVDLSNGEIIGYDAKSYYTCHVSRTLEKASYDIALAKAKIPSDFNIGTAKLVLAPLDYNRQVLCYEFKATSGADTYYFYYNAVTGEEENILKVVATTNGNLLA